MTIPNADLQFDRFIAAAATECWFAPREHQVFFATTGAIGPITISGDNSPGFQSRVDGLLARHRGMAAFGTRVFAARGAAEPADTWMLTAVSRGLPARILIRRIGLDNRWSLLEPGECPWFAISTAAAMRAALTDGAMPISWRTAETASLYATPDDGIVPPADDLGRI